ncbi:tyrosine-type recombinase/integrase [Roseimaritima ulvae]|uniref:Phage integrase family protein n=1 Tax=Roseimaritima ulvae TaxID=980254 RepID=A0A5B9QSI8_9BACT|nr:hypothetical protein [Roseimaritima ulvae]QEG42087.1 hypothetical protein UC8_41170 [Roseimaritima ulvae]
MPFKYQLTWIQQAKRWRKRYRSKTYYLKTRTGGKRDRAGYLEALAEWERLKAFIDGLGPNPYTATGAIIPEAQLLKSGSVYLPPAPVPQPAPDVVSVADPAHTVTQTLGPDEPKDTAEPLPPWIIGTGIGPMLHPELVVSDKGTPTGERRISKLAEVWHSERRKQVERGELTLKQWSEDQSKLQVFRDFIFANYPNVVFADQITPEILNQYRDKQWEFVDCGTENSIGRETLKKRLSNVRQWLGFLVDHNYLAELPKDLSKYARVKIDKPKPIFWTIAEIKKLAEQATPRTKLYLMLGLNCGWTQKDIATLEASMIDWDTRIIERGRSKTGVRSKCRLWPSTLALLERERRNNSKTKGPLLLNANGLPLYYERVNDRGKIAIADAIRFSFDRLKNRKKMGFKEHPCSFKHLRKTGANEIEKINPELTGLYLAHSEGQMKRHYVEQQFEALFVETDKLESLFGFA